MTNAKTLCRISALFVGLALALFGLESQCAGPMFMPSEDHHHPSPPKPPMTRPSVVPTPPVRHPAIDATQRHQALQWAKEQIEVHEAEGAPDTPDRSPPGKYGWFVPNIALGAPPAPMSDRNCCKGASERVDPKVKVKQYKPGYTDGDVALKARGFDPKKPGAKAENVDIQKLTAPAFLVGRDITGTIRHMATKKPGEPIKQNYNTQDMKGEFEYTPEFKNMKEFLDKGGVRPIGEKERGVGGLSWEIYTIPPKSPTSTGP